MTDVEEGGVHLHGYRVGVEVGWAHPRVVLVEDGGVDLTRLLLELLRQVVPVRLASAASTRSNRRLVKGLFFTEKNRCRERGTTLKKQAGLVKAFSHGNRCFAGW